MPLSAVSSPRRVDIASVSGQDSPIILDTPQLPEYRVSSPNVHPEDGSPQSIPVILNRGKPQPRKKNFSNGTNSRSQDSWTNRSSPQQHNKVLFLGDSIIKGVNSKGLKSGIHKNFKSGGNIQTMIAEVRLYDLKAFSAVIIYAGGNNVASGETIEFIEEKYDEFISLIVCGNSTARVYLCSVALRKDADVPTSHKSLYYWIE